MTSSAVRVRRHCRPPPARQRGVVLFIALIAMVILMLAGVALVRSVESSTSVAGNLAFRQASIAPVNQKIEEAVSKLFTKPIAPIVDKTTTDAAQGYYASLQAGEKANGVPAVLSGTYANMTTAYAAAGLPAPYVDGVTNLEVRSVIERICLADGAATTANCDLMPPKVSPAGTDNEVKRIPLPPIPHFRVTVRVDIPNTNTVSYAQAFLR
jgi:type IV pilus assembly protein PilX